MKITLEQLNGLEGQIVIDFEKLEQSTSVVDRRLWTYLTSYPYYLDFFEDAEEITPTELIQGCALVYSWMPTTLNFRKNNFEEVLESLNRLKDDGKRLSAEEFSRLKALVNNSVTGTSKLLHFINPTVYPIWDSRVNRILTGSKSGTNTISKYENYLELFDGLIADEKMEIVREALSTKINQPISKARAFEMLLFLGDLFKLSPVFKAFPKKKKPSTVQIPKYKRDEFVFISNLGTVTADPLNPKTTLRDGYLLSEHYTTKSSIERAKWVRSRRNLLISDNGNWTRMCAIAREFSDEGDDILNQAKDELKKQGEVAEKTLADRADLIQRITQKCDEVRGELDFEKIIGKQLLIRPHYMIGLEDFSIPVMMMCGMLDDTFSPDAESIVAYQKKTAELYSQQYEGELGFEKQLKESAKFLVLHSYNYDSSYLGGEQIKDVSKDGIAISYGAPMRSRRYITRIKLGDKWMNFEEKLPEAYIIAQAITLGAMNALKDDTPIHILGVGSPILIALTGYLTRQSKAVSIDSSAPFQDAYDGKIYGNRHAFLKMDMYKVAAYALINDQPYESKTPFFQDFEKVYPSNWADLRKTMSITKDTSVKELAKELKSRQDLVEQYIPFFTKMRGGKEKLIQDLRIARSGHNYWVLKEICEHIKDRRDDEQKLFDWTQMQVERYKKIGSSKWGKAVEKAFELSLNQ